MFVVEIFFPILLSQREKGISSITILATLTSMLSSKDPSSSLMPLVMSKVMFGMLPDLMWAKNSGWDSP